MSGEYSGMICRALRDGGVVMLVTFSLWCGTPLWAWAAGGLMGQDGLRIQTTQGGSSFVGGGEVRIPQVIRGRAVTPAYPVDLDSFWKVKRGDHLKVELKLRNELELFVKSKRIGFLEQSSEA